MKNAITYLKEYQRNGGQVAIYCAGRHGILFSEILQMCGIQINGFFDNNPEKWDIEISTRICCRNPNRIKDKKSYIILVCIDPRYYTQVKKEVLEAGYENIMEFSDILDDVILNYQSVYLELIRLYQNRSAAELFYTPSINRQTFPEVVNVLGKKDRIAVYTGIFGDYDSICEPAVLPLNVDYFIVSDINPKKKSPYIWIDAGKIIPASLISPVKRNRYIKMHPHILFPEYKYSIYLDGNIRIQEDITSFVKENPSGISVFLHPKRDCIFYEAVTITNFHRVVAKDVCKQMKRYLDEGMPIHYGMPEMPVIAREHNKPSCIRVMEDWWIEFNKGALRDQLSFMYAMWKNQMTLQDLSSLGENVRQDNRLRFHAHNYESRMLSNKLTN